MTKVLENYMDMKTNETVKAMKFTDANKNQVFNTITCTREPIFINGEPALKLRSPKGYQIVMLNDYIIKEGEGLFHAHKGSDFTERYILLTYIEEDYKKYTDKECIQ
ncbi:hypothetical protein CHOTACABRAS_280 [Bacillus phage Chotacabras]|nr:hypothetical protein CHOTACABRAS_280 [Bacillus phage Chotacabras]